MGSCKSKSLPSRAPSEVVKTTQAYDRDDPRAVTEPEFVPVVIPELSLEPEQVSSDSESEHSESDTGATSEAAGISRSATPLQKTTESSPGGLNLPALESDPCSASFGNSTTSRFEEIELAPGPGDYNFKDIWTSLSCGATFGVAGEERFLDIPVTVGPGAYNLTEVAGEPCTASFGKSTEERFADTPVTLGPGAYDPCFPNGFPDIFSASFGMSKEERFHEIEVTLGPGAYDLPEVAAEPCTASFGKSTEERFQEPEVTIGAGAYDLPKVETPAAASSFGKKTEKRFKKTKRTLGPGQYKPKKKSKKIKKVVFSKSRRFGPCIW